MGWWSVGCVAEPMIATCTQHSWALSFNRMAVPSPHCRPFCADGGAAGGQRCGVAGRRAREAAGSTRRTAIQGGIGRQDPSSAGQPGSIM